MAKTKPPAPPPSGSKGAPPVPDAAPQNLDRPARGDTANLTFTVPKTFRNDLKVYAVEQGKSMVDVLYEALALHGFSHEE